MRWENGDVVEPLSWSPLTLSSRNTLPFFPVPPAFLRDGPLTCWDAMMRCYRTKAGWRMREIGSFTLTLIDLLVSDLNLRWAVIAARARGRATFQRISLQRIHDKTNHHLLFCHLVHIHPCQCHQRPALTAHPCLIPNPLSPPAPPAPPGPPDYLPRPRPDASSACSLACRTPRLWCSRCLWGCTWFRPLSLL